jgi:hypothetical protein
MRRAMEYWKITMPILAMLSVSFVLADDIKTITGKEYKNVTVSRVEADGIVIKGKSGITKLYFAELPKEVQERYNYNAEKAAAYSAVEKFSKPSLPSTNQNQ